MLGLTQAAVTARMIADLVTNHTTFMDPAPFSPARCGG
jgi:glycine/D-amino acid oxidase-like deaminating enzyme